VLPTTGDIIAVSIAVTLLEVVFAWAFRAYTVIAGDADCVSTISGGLEQKCDAGGRISHV